MSAFKTGVGKVAALLEDEARADEEEAAALDGAVAASAAAVAGGDEEMADAEDDRAQSHGAASTSQPAAAAGKGGRKAARGRGRSGGGGGSSSGANGAAEPDAAAAAASGNDDPSAAAPSDPPSRKRRKVGVAMSPDLRASWRRFSADLAAAERAAAAAEGGFAFAFVEGALVTALREGWWLLLDEVNLAPAEVLERIAGVLETSSSSSSMMGGDNEAPESSGLLLVERGDAAAVPRHPAFRLVAAMNPATDAGKHDLPPRLRSRFTELWVAEPGQRADQCMLVAGYLAGAAPNPPVDAVVDFYRAAKAEAVGMAGVVPLI